MFFGLWAACLQTEKGFMANEKRGMTMQGETIYAFLLTATVFSTVTGHPMRAPPETIDANTSWGAK